MRYAESDMKCCILALVLVACSGSSDKEVMKPTPPDTVSVAPDAAPLAEEPATPPSGDKLSAEECEQLFEHVFQIAVTREQEALEKAKRSKATVIEEVKANMRGQLVPQCLTLTRVELKFDCYMAATDSASVDACDKE
jgi:hypothetical protein